MLVSQVWSLDLLSLKLLSSKRTTPAVSYLAQHIACHTMHVTHSKLHMACHTMHVTHSKLHMACYTQHVTTHCMSHMACYTQHGTTQHMHLMCLFQISCSSFCFVSAIMESGQVIPLHIASADDMADFGTATSMFVDLCRCKS